MCGAQVALGGLFPFWGCRVRAPWSSLWAWRGSGTVPKAAVTHPKPPPNFPKPHFGSDCTWGAPNSAGPQCPWGPQGPFGGAGGAVGGPGGPPGPPNPLWQWQRVELLPQGLRGHRDALACPRGARPWRAQDDQRGPAQGWASGGVPRGWGGSLEGLGASRGGQRRVLGGSLVGSGGFWGTPNVSKGGEGWDPELPRGLCEFVDILEGPCGVRGGSWGSWGGVVPGFGGLTVPIAAFLPPRLFPEGSGGQRALHLDRAVTPGPCWMWTHTQTPLWGFFFFFYLFLPFSVLSGVGRGPPDLQSPTPK